MFEHCKDHNHTLTQVRRGFLALVVGLRVLCFYRK